MDAPNHAMFYTIDDCPLYDVSTKAELSRSIITDFMTISKYQPILAVLPANNSKYLACLKMPDVFNRPGNAAMISVHIPSTTVSKTNQVLQE